MDEFGVLTERYGLKQQGKSAPMSQAKRSTATATASTNQNFGFPSVSSRSSMSFSSKSSWDSGPSNGSLLDDHGNFYNGKPQDGLGLGDNYDYGVGGFGRTTQKQQNTSNNSSNASSFDLDSMLFNLAPKSSSLDSFVIDDIFGGIPGSQKASNGYDYESFTSFTKQNGSVGNLLGDFSGVAAKLKSSTGTGLSDYRANEAYSDDLIPGFGGSSHSNNSTKVRTTKSAHISTEDPFVILESASSSAYNFSESSTNPLADFSIFNQSGGTKVCSSSDASSSLQPPLKSAEFSKADKVKSSDASPIDEDFAMGRVHNKFSRSKEAEDANKKTQQMGEDLESFFGASSRSNSAPKSRAATSVPVFGANIHNRQQKTSAGVSSTAKKTSSAAMAFGVEDLSSVFGATPMFGEFEEVEGESEERRSARYGRQQRTQDRVARAVADMNQRDHQAQYEQEERHRIAEAVDFEIKRWAAGKEGNMRALLSSLQLVLWSECGWEPVSLTDLITSGSVKKVYRKATLCVHPDKVQQKGATLEQKYIAEKVFDILKEAWNKFNREELS